MVGLGRLVRQQLQHAKRKPFRVLSVDRENQLIADALMGQGRADHAPVYPCEIARRALEVSASRLILIHAPPSGDPKPSRAEIDIIDVLEPLDSIHGHLIAATSGVTSFKTSGLI